MSVLEDLKSMEQRVMRRLGELRPLVEEYQELEKVARRLGLDTTQPARRKPSKGRRAGGRRLATRRSTGGRVQRRDQVLALVNERPGITVPEIAKELKVDPTGLYRVVRQLQGDGAIEKEGTALRPV